MFYHASKIMREIFAQSSNSTELHEDEDKDEDNGNGRIKKNSREFYPISTIDDFSTIDS